MSFNIAAQTASQAAAQATALPQFRFPSPAEATTPVAAANQIAGRGADAAAVPTMRITVQRGDTVETLARDYGTTISQLALVNPRIRDLDSIRVGDRINVPTNRQVVEVKAGDTLDKLAERYGVSAEQIRRTNGIANADDIQAGQRIAIVPTATYGLDNNASVRAFIADVVPLQRDWAKLTPAQRLDRLGDALNERLRAAGVPEVNVRAGGVGTANGVYDFNVHTIRIDPATLNQRTITSDQLRGVADTLLHEGRHAQQWFDMARLEVARGNDPADMGLPADVVQSARDAPALDPASARGRFTAAMYESVYGTGSAARNAVLGNITAANYEDYRRLPEEADAWRVGGKILNFWPR